MTGAGQYWQELASMFGVESHLELHEVLTSVILCECVYKRVERNGERGAVEAMKRLREKFPSDEAVLPRLNSVQWCREDVENQKYLVAENKESMFVVLMGTKEMRDAWTDLKVNKKEFLMEPGTVIGGGQDAMAVHEGFLERADSLRVEAMYNHARRLGRRLVLAGHSLGGSVAKICALKLLFSGCDVQSIHCVCFGAPALADKKISDIVRLNGWSSVLKSYYTLHDPTAWILAEDFFGKSEKKDGFLQSIIHPSMKNIIGINKYHHVGVQIVLQSPTVVHNVDSSGQYRTGLNVQAPSRQNWLSHHRMSTYRTICSNICAKYVSESENASSVCWNTLKNCSVETEWMIISKPEIRRAAGDMPLIRLGWESFQISVKLKGFQTDFITSAVLVLPNEAKIRCDCIQYPSMEEYGNRSSEHLETIVFFNQVPINALRELRPKKTVFKHTDTKGYISLRGLGLEMFTDFVDSVLCTVEMMPNVAWIVPMDQEGKSAFAEMHQRQVEKLPSYLLYSDGLLLMDISRALGGPASEEMILKRSLLLLGGSPGDLGDNYHMGWYESLKGFFINRISWLKWNWTALTMYLVHGSLSRQMQHPRVISILTSKRTIMNKLSVKNFAIFHTLTYLSKLTFMRGISVVLACLGENTLGIKQKRMIADISGLRPETGKVLFLDSNDLQGSIDTLILELCKEILKANYPYSKM